MLKARLISAAACAALLYGISTQAGVPYKIVTADPRGTYFAIGNDLAKMVAPQAGIDLEVVPTNGSAENIKLLRHEPGVKRSEERRVGKECRIRITLTHYR